MSPGVGHIGARICRLKEITDTLAYPKLGKLRAPCLAQAIPHLANQL